MHVCMYVETEFCEGKGGDWISWEFPDLHLAKGAGDWCPNVCDDFLVIFLYGQALMFGGELGHSFDTDCGLWVGFEWRWGGVEG